MSQSVISKDTAVEVKAQTIEGRRLHHGPSGSSPKLFHTPDLSGPNVFHFCWLPTYCFYRYSYVPIINNYAFR